MGTFAVYVYLYIFDCFIQGIRPDWLTAISILYQFYDESNHENIPFILFSASMRMVKAIWKWSEMQM